MTSARPAAIAASPVTDAEGVRPSAAEGRLRPDPAGPGVPGAGECALCLGAGAPGRPRNRPRDAEERPHKAERLRGLPVMPAARTYAGGNPSNWGATATAGDHATPACLLKTA